MDNDVNYVTRTMFVNGNYTACCKRKKCIDRPPLFTFSWVTPEVKIDWLKITYISIVVHCYQTPKPWVKLCHRVISNTCKCSPKVLERWLKDVTLPCNLICRRYSGTFQLTEPHSFVMLKLCSPSVIVLSNVREIILKWTQILLWISNPISRF